MNIPDLITFPVEVNFLPVELNGEVNLCVKRVPREAGRDRCRSQEQEGWRSRSVAGENH